ncbi:family 2A encapsulin nanocompartment cargo protein cysteine desulfurase [Synechococcus elongatus IITB4]|uniref:family 2A encapsulin nanocompartment cargo protein cysteine desulfurase n=1 Tax=Synechococcus elongatus TaxID=32046 RepID=UPI0030D596C3
MTNTVPSVPAIPNLPTQPDPFFNERSLEQLTQTVLQDLQQAGVSKAESAPIPPSLPTASLPNTPAAVTPQSAAAIANVPTPPSSFDERSLAQLAQAVLQDPQFANAIAAVFPAATVPTAASVPPAATALPSFAPSLVPSAPPIHDEVGVIPHHQLPVPSQPTPTGLQQPPAGSGVSGFYFIDEQVETAIAALQTSLTVFPQLNSTPAIPVLTGAHSAGAVGFDIHQVRRDFPILKETVNGRPLIWFDNAATTQKPQVVIDRLSHYYQHENSNIHRAAHELAARSTDAYESAREQVRRFLNAASTEEIVFVRGTTEAINLVAKSWGAQNLKEGDEIVITWLEHHANIVPWQQLSAETGAQLRVVPVDDHGQVRLDEYQKLLSDRTKIVSFTQVSNALGTITPAREIIELAHRYGAKVLLDGAQSVSHLAVDVQALDCDWFVFSGHKVFGPTGIGVLYGKQELLNATLPWQSGGNMIADVTFEKTVYQPAPARFEAGTGNIADAVGLGTALDYVQKIGLEAIAAYEHELLLHGTALLSEIPGLRLIGTAPHKAAVLSFVLEGFSPEAIGQALNREGIAVRAGHHCAQPILRRFGLETTVRPSLAFYNTFEELETLAAAIHRIQVGSIPL